MTIQEYKEKFIELANQMEEEHGYFSSINVNVEVYEYSEVAKSNKKTVKIEF